MRATKKHIGGRITPDRCHVTSLAAAANIPLIRRSAYTAANVSIKAKVAIVAPKPVSPIARRVLRPYRSDSFPHIGANKNNENM